MDEASYREKRIRIEIARNQLLREIITKLDNIDKSIWESITSEEVGDALRAITNIPGMSVGVDMNDTIDVKIEEE